MHEARGGAVDLHLARAPLAGDRVRLEAAAVVDVDDGTCSCSRMSAASRRSGSMVIEPT
jgi:hypothetical protein